MTTIESYTNRGRPSIGREDRVRLAVTGHHDHHTYNGNPPLPMGTKDCLRIRSILHSFYESDWIGAGPIDKIDAESIANRIPGVRLAAITDQETRAAWKTVPGVLYGQEESVFDVHPERCATICDGMRRSFCAGSGSGGTEVAAGKSTRSHAVN